MIVPRAVGLLPLRAQDRTTAPITMGMRSCVPSGLKRAHVQMRALRASRTLDPFKLRGSQYSSLHNASLGFVGRRRLCSVTAAAAQDSAETKSVYGKYVCHTPYLQRYVKSSKQKSVQLSRTMEFCFDMECHHLCRTSLINQQSANEDVP
jgi:hypothetical protein